MQKSADSFVLLTAAKNEAKYIGVTIESVLRQSVLPKAWYIVDDGSTDETAEIVRRFAQQHNFIHLHTIVSRNGGERNFGAQYRAINKAYSLVKAEAFEFVCMLDADIGLKSNYYFRSIIDEFERDVELGLTGGYIYERSGDIWKCRPANSPTSVAGGVQMFRRACFDEIGGYQALMYGGEDWLAQVHAQHAGWKVRSLLHLPVHHYRPTSSAGGRLKGIFRMGMRDASFGSHPAFELVKCVRRVREAPALINPLVRLSGYFWYGLKHKSPVVPSNVVQTLRKEQIRRVFEWTKRPFNRSISSDKTLVSQDEPLR